MTDSTAPKASTASMSAIAFGEFGSPDVLRRREMPLPEPGPGQVRIAVRAAGLNALDTKIRAGVMQQVFPVALPHVPGVEAAGVVDALGDGVGGLTVGDQVFGPTVSGAYAEYALAAADVITLKPGPLGWAEAAALPVAAETSYRVLELLAPRPGETLLVHAAAGGVGVVAVQIAVARGVTVIGTAGEGNHELLRSLGVIPVAYGDGLVERVRALAPDGVDAALDAAGRGGSLTDSVELTGGADRVVTIVDPGAAARAGVRFSSGAGERHHRPAFEEALALFDTGKLRIPVHRAYPLEQAAEAHRESERGHVSGKIVLTV